METFKFYISNKELRFCGATSVFGPIDCSKFATPKWTLVGKVDLEGMYICGLYHRITS